MDTFLMQDWVSLTGISTLASLTQSASAWLDLAPFQDVVFYLDARDATNAQLAYETAPIKDESFFRSMAQFTLSASTTPDVRKVRLADDPTTPLARWVRWRLIRSAAGSPWSATFRIHAVANAICL